MGLAIHPLQWTHTIHNLYIIVCRVLYYPYYIIHPPLLDCISNCIIPNNIIADSRCTEGELQSESCSEDSGADEDGSGEWEGGCTRSGETRTDGANEGRTCFEFRDLLVYTWKSYQCPSFSVLPIPLSPYSAWSLNSSLPPSPSPPPLALGVPADVWCVWQAPPTSRYLQECFQQNRHREGKGICWWNSERHGDSITEGLPILWGWV